MSTPPDYREKFRGAMLGLALGDAIGAPFEGGPSVSLEEVEKSISSREVLGFTDDTEMTIAVAESLLRSGGFNGEDMAKSFVNHFNPARGYGAATAHAIQRLKAGEKWDAVGEESYGNGAAMRAAPIGLLYNQNLEKVGEVAEASSRITHTHPLGIEGAVLLAASVALLSRSWIVEEFSPEAFLSKLMELEKNEVYLSRLNEVKSLRGTPDRRKVIERLGNGGEAPDSVPTAIFFFSSTPEDFRLAVLSAVALGGDADTIASMTGALAGAHLGVQAIPGDWVEKLETHGKIEELADRMFYFFVKELLGGYCEMCMGREKVKVYRIDPTGGDDLSNLILLCPQCKDESEEVRERYLRRPAKAGKYRAVYRKSYKK